MKVAMFDSHGFERSFFRAAALKHGHEISHFEVRLNPETAVLANGYPCVCCFVNDQLSAAVLRVLALGGCKLIALRSAGFNNVDLTEARNLGLRVVRVPSYSPNAVAEHAVALLLSLNRKVHRAYSRVHDLNFSLEGLVGFDLFGKTIGVIGIGKIGAVFGKIMVGFGCRVLAFDPNPSSLLSADTGIQPATLEEIYKESDVISLHVPLTAATHHMIDQRAFKQMKKGVIIINTGRGALIDTKALGDALKAGQIGGAGLDVYEEEENVFFENLSERVLQDDVLARLLTFPNVLITSHQGFLTKEALSNIAETTLQSVTQFVQGHELTNEIVQK